MSQCSSTQAVPRGGSIIFGGQEEIAAGDHLNAPEMGMTANQRFDISRKVRGTKRDSIFQWHYCFISISVGTLCQIWTQNDLTLQGTDAVCHVSFYTN